MTGSQHGTTESEEGDTGSCVTDRSLDQIESKAA